MGVAISHALPLITVAIALVLLTRRPVRRGFGAGPAFALWMLPLLAAALPWLPALPVHWAVLPAIHALSDTSPAASPVHTTTSVPWLGLAWLVGACRDCSRTTCACAVRAAAFPGP
jgi:beta-lactamase regulating signal transducer with metallopeptidase domain